MQGRIHPLPAVLGLVALAVRMGRTGLQGIARFGRQYGTPLAHARGFRRGQTPSASTLSRTLRRIAPQQLEAALGRWIAGRLTPDARAHVALDGKCLRGSRGGHVPGPHRVARHVPARRGGARPDPGGRPDERAPGGPGVARDRLGAHRGCHVLPAGRGRGGGRRRGHYVLTAKDNQPGLVADIEAGLGFEDAARGLAAATSP
ncbi:transposase family protein [Gemmata obscuriglobus]|uniref:transposase family protein n=1 Tax=Gemmata obscuriglobus TaxID=114 RepID=UPI000D6D8979|nr:transposase family protein [Gemmata obscuriglobus]